jgi:hypothetical protein
VADGIGLYSPSTTPQFRAQFLAQFIESYIPRDSMLRCSIYQAALSWYKDLPYSLGYSNILDAALLALSLVFLGRRYHDIRLDNESRRLYTFVVTKILQLRQPETLKDDLISTSIGMAIYEV